MPTQFDILGVIDHNAKARGAELSHFRLPLKKPLFGLWEHVATVDVRGSIMVTQNARTDPGKYPSLSKVVFLTPSRKSIEKTQETVANNSHLVHYVRTERLSVRT